MDAVGDSGPPYWLCKADYGRSLRSFPRPEHPYSVRFVPSVHPLADQTLVKCCHRLADHPGFAPLRRAHERPSRTHP